MRQRDLLAATAEALVEIADLGERSLRGLKA